MSDTDEKKPEKENSPERAEAEQRPRPNAAYSLSKKNTLPDELPFYYSREDRLAKASKEVRALYTGKPLRFSLLRPLIGSKPRAMLFFSILVLCAAILLLSYLGYW
jgi:hypothetical protein